MPVVLTQKTTTRLEVKEYDQELVFCTTGRGITVDLVVRNKQEGKVQQAHAVFSPEMIKDLYLQLQQFLSEEKTTLRVSDLNEA